MIWADKQTVEHRRKICGQCPHRRNGWRILDFMPNFISDGFKRWQTCGVCNCFIHAKTKLAKGLTKCPKEKWT